MQFNFAAHCNTLFVNSREYLPTIGFSIAHFWIWTLGYWSTFYRDKSLHMESIWKPKSWWEKNNFKPVTLNDILLVQKMKNAILTFIVSSMSKKAYKHFNALLWIVEFIIIQTYCFYTYKVLSENWTGREINCQQLLTFSFIQALEL